MSAARACASGCCAVAKDCIADAPSWQSRAPPSQEYPMKVAKVRVYLAASGRLHPVSVGIVIAEAVTGKAAIAMAWGAAAALMKDLGQRLIAGRDPLPGRATVVGNLRPSFAAIGAFAFEQALWGIKGKVRGVPVYEMLGGKVHDRVPCLGQWLVWRCRNRRRIRQGRRATPARRLRCPSGCSMDACAAPLGAQIGVAFQTLRSHARCGLPTTFCRHASSRGGPGSRRAGMALTLLRRAVGGRRTTPPLALMPLRYVDHANSVRECVSVEEPCHDLQPYGLNARVGQLRLRAQQHQRADQHFAGVLAIMVRASVEQRRQEPRNATMQPLNACAGWCGQSRATQYVGNSAHQHNLSANCDRQIASSSGKL